MGTNLLSEITKQMAYCEAMMGKIRLNVLKLGRKDEEGPRSYPLYPLARRYARNDCVTLRRELTVLRELLEKYSG